MRVFFTQWRKIIEKNDEIQHERKTAQFSTVLFLCVCGIREGWEVIAGEECAYPTMSDVTTLRPLLLYIVGLFITVLMQQE